MCGEGRYLEGSTEKRAAIFIGGEFSTVLRADLVEAAREAGDGRLRRPDRLCLQLRGAHDRVREASRPFEKPKHGRSAVKVINHLGDEVMKVFKV